MTKKQKELIRIYALLMIPVSLVLFMAFAIFYEPVEQSQITSMDQLPIGSDIFSNLKTTGKIRYKWTQKYRYDELFITGHTTNSALSDFANQFKYSDFFKVDWKKTSETTSILTLEDLVSQIQNIEKELGIALIFQIDPTTEKWFFRGSDLKNKIAYISMLGTFDPDTKRFWARIDIHRGSD